MQLVEVEQNKSALKKNVDCADDVDVMQRTLYPDRGKWSCGNK